MRRHVLRHAPRLACSFDQREGADSVGERLVSGSVDGATAKVGGSVLTLTLPTVFGRIFNQSSSQRGQTR